MFLTNFDEFSYKKNAKDNKDNLQTNLDLCHKYIQFKLNNPVSLQEAMTLASNMKDDKIVSLYLEKIKNSSIKMIELNDFNRFLNNFRPKINFSPQEVK